MGAQSRTVEERLAGLASRRHGLVTRQQLLAAGVSRREIARRLRIGSLIQVHRGVYRVGHAAPSLESRYLAAVLAGGDRAVLSGLAAAHLLGLVKGRPPPPEVTAPTERRVRGIVTRRARLDRSDRTLWRGIPVTSVPRTFVDIAARLSPRPRAAFHEAGIRHHTTPEQVEEALPPPQCAGAAELRLVTRGDVHVTLSHLEQRFLTPLLPLASSYLRPIDGRGRSGSTAAGRPPTSPSSSTATATTAPVTRGSRTVAASAKRIPR